MASSWNRAFNAIVGHCWLEMKSTASKSFNAHFLKFWSLLTLCGLWNCNPMWPHYRPGSRIEFQVFLSANWITLPDIKIKPKFHQDSTAKAVLVWLPDIHLKSVFQELIIFALAMQIHYINVNKQLWRHACVFGLGLLNSSSFTDFYFLKRISLSIFKVLLKPLNANYRLLRNICSSQFTNPLDYHAGLSFNIY